MNDETQRTKLLFERFEGLSRVVAGLTETDISWGIGGSASLYLHGLTRFPHDIDVIFTAEGHDRADALFGVRSQRVETDAYQARKSAPGKDPISFLSDYYIKVGDRRVMYDLTSEMIVTMDSPGGSIHVLRPEVIVAAKVLLNRSDDRKQDRQDVLQMVKAHPLDTAYLTELARRLGAEALIRETLSLSD